MGSCISSSVIFRVSFIELQISEIFPNRQNLIGVFTVCDTNRMRRGADNTNRPESVLQIRREARKRPDRLLRKGPVVINC